VSFVHDFPGAVKMGLLDDMKGVIPMILRAFFWLVGRWICIPIEECGERHLFLATSAKYPSANMDEDNGCGVPLADGVAMARGTNGMLRSGVYSVGWEGESSGLKVKKLLAGLRDKAMVE